MYLVQIILTTKANPLIGGEDTRTSDERKTRCTEMEASYAV